MKKILSILVIACIALVFAGCQKDGVYNPSKKISKIYYTPIDGQRTLQEAWTWNKNILEKIDFYYDGVIDYSYNFEYDGKRLAKISNLDADRYAEYIYDGNKLSAINVYYHGNLKHNYKFIYKNGKLAQLIEPELSKGVNTKDILGINPLDFVFDAEICKVMDNAEKTLAAKHGDKGEYDKTWDFTWEKGNVKTCVINEYYSDFVETLTCTFTYDNKNNPYENSHVDIHPNNDISNGNFAKHNIIRVVQVATDDIYVDETYTTVYDYEYTYSGKYPVSRRASKDEEGYVTHGGLYEYEYLK